MTTQIRQYAHAHRSSCKDQKVANRKLVFCLPVRPRPENYTYNQLMDYNAAKIRS